ncbi:MAG: phage holin family protein, partial [Verrucomicrobia bacterium]|nr:phage holin family protein [Verrucomicrobiota bacterium]
MNNRVLQLLVSWAVLALGVTLATNIVTGLSCDNTTVLIKVVLLLSFFNAIIKPLLLIFTLPFILLTMGLGVIVINALLFFWVGKLVDGFHVASFWSALGGALIVSLTNLILSGLMRDKNAPRRRGGQPPQRPAEPAKKD